MKQDSSMEVISQATCIFTALMSCLFGLYQGICAYNSTSPTPFFTLGEAISAFGLIFAVYQLKNKSWDVVLRIRDSWQRNLFWYLGIAGLVAIAISAFLWE